ncbi:MAG TPA: ABC transporter permease [Ruminococcaceae bacterium]|nr:ABC transporter permease [Oscillospiraceae bacterium]HCA28226.1 ABC transporter permease [Oscillospiraceae bacterium]
MNLSSIRYLIRESFRNIWQNKLMAVASIGVLISCLLLTGGSYLVYANINHTFEWIDSQNVVVAFAKEDSTDVQLTVLEDKIKCITNVDTVEFVSKEQALLRYKDSMTDAVFEEMQGENNPYLDSFVVTFKDLSKFKDTIKQMDQIPEIEDIVYSEDTAKQLTNIRNIMLLASGCIILLLLVVSLFIIANTIKLTVYNRRLEISIMKSVGATNVFVRIPFIIEGIVLGVFSACLSYGIVFLVYSKLYDMVGRDIMGGLLEFSAVWHVMLLGFIALGVLTGIAGSAISMRRYLRDEGGISSVI